MSDQIDSADESGSEDITLYEYSLVHFIKRGRKSVKREMDIVPTNWIRFSKQKGRCTTKFLSASNNQEDTQLLHDLVKVCADAPEDWEDFTIDIKGRAKTYEEALKKFEVLKSEEHCFTASDAPALTKQMTEDIKKRQLKNDLEKMKAQLNVSLSYNSDGSHVETNAFNKNQEPEKSSNEDRSRALISSILHEGASTSTGIQNSYSKLDSYEETDSGTDNIESHLKRKKLRKKVDSLPSKSHSPHSSDLENVPVIEPLKTINTTSSFGAAASSDKKDTNFSLPVIDISHVNIECDKEYKIAVLSELSIIRQQLNTVQSTQAEASNYMIDKQVVCTKKVNFQKKYNFLLPFDDKEQFLRFNENMKSNRYLQNDVCMLLKTCLDKDLVISKTFLHMIRAFMTQDLAMRYTAARKSRSKENPKDQLKPLEFYKCMEAVTVSAREDKKLDTNERDLMASLSNVLSNVKNWKKPIS